MNYSFMETNNSITMDKALCRLLDVPFPTDGDLNEKSIEDTLLEAVSGLKKSLLAKDQSFAQEHMRRTAAEQELASLARKRSDELLEADLLSQKVESLTSKLSAAESEKQGLLLQNAGQVSKIAEITGAIEDLRHKTSGLQFQLEEAARVRERLQISLDSVSEAADSANDKLLLRRQELCVLEEKVIEKNSLVLRLEVELEEVRNEFERSNREKEWAISSKAEVDRELEELRARLLKQNLELKANLEAAQVSQSVQVERLKSLENENSGMVRQIVDLQDRLEQVTSSKTALEAEFIAEIASKSKISDLYKEGMESLAKKVEELESMISNGESLGCGGLVKAFSPNTLFTSDRLSKNHNELSIDELCKSGQVENLQHAIQCMCEEVEARAAQVKSQADELENLRGTVSVLSKNLAESAKMKEQQSAETICIREGLKSLEYELTMKEQTIVDLTRQVHVLLAESEGVKPDDAVGALVDSDKVIDNQFVTFKSIQEMHAKHGQLLRVLRELGARQERTDSLDKEMSILNSRLEDARNQLSEVQISRQRQATLIESLLRQRDTLRMACVTQNQPTDVLSINDHLLPENSNVNYSPELVSGEIQYHALRDESEYEIGREESKRVEENLLQRVNQLQSEMIAKNGRIAILEASLAMSAERLKLWKENEKGIREELNVIRHSYSGMMEANAKLQCSNQSLLDDLIQSRADLGEFKQQTSSLRANLNVSQEEVGRLGKEILNLRSDREKLSELISSLKNQYLSRNEQDDRVPALRSQLEITERELQVARSRIHDSSELIRSSQQAHEREYRELVLRHDELQKEHRQLLEKINMIEHTRLTSNKVDESSPYEVGVSNENLVQGYRLRLDSLTEEILSLKKLLDESTGQADYYRKELEEVTKCLAISKKESDERMAKLSEKASLADSIDSLKAQHAEDILRADKERLLLQDRVALFDEMIQTLQSIGFTGLNSASDLANTLSEANSRFEEEHSLRVKISLELDDLKIKAEDFQKQLHDTASQVDEWKMKCSGLDAELGAIKTVHQSVIEERVEIERQNSGLISRLESLVSSTGSGDVNTSDAATKDLMETISFLRKRKDALQVEHDKLGLEYRRLKVTHVKLQQSIEANEKGEGNQQDIINKSQEYEQTISRLNIVNDTLKTANDDLIEQCRQLRTQINNVLSERSRDEERLSALQVRIAALGHFGEMEGKLEESESKASNLEAELSESKRCCESLEIEIKHLQKNEALATDELSKLKSLFKTTNTELNQSKEAHQTVLNDLLQLRQLHGTCEHELEKLKAERDSLIDELKDAKESDAGALNIDQIKEQLTQSEAKFKRLLLQTQSIAAARNDLVKKVKDFEAQLTERNAACEGLAVKVSQLESQLTDALDRITNLQSRTEPVTVRDDSIIAEKDEQILQLTARIERYSEALKRFAKIRDNYKECNARLRGAVEQIEGYESRIEEMKKEHDLRCQLLTSTWQARLDRLVNSGGDNGTQKQSFGQVVHGALSSGHIRGNGVSDSGEKASKSISNQNVNQIPSVDSNGLVDEFNLGQDVENENNVDSVVSLKSSVKESKGTRQKQLIPHEVVPSGEPSYFFAEESPFLDSGNHGMDFLHSNKLKPELNSTLIPSKRLAYNDERFGSEIGSPNADEDVELGGSKVPNAPLELDSFDTLNNSVINESSSAQFVIIPQTLEPNFSPLHAKLTDKIEETDAKTLQSSVNNNEEKFVHESFEAKSSSSCLRPHDDGSEGSTTVELEVRSNLVESKLNDSKLEISSPKSKDSEGQLEIKKNIKFENFIDKKPIMMQSCKDEEFDKADDGDIQLVGMKRVQEVIEQRSVLRKDLPSLSMSNVLFSSSVDESRKESVDEGNISPRDI